ncbi:hypothetical protein NM208_g15624 [Fusarium decemcellulare]|uniref:Uncharacterized protein n=1 Tax=Fusarium decemcellulare TaxID=57161 RepID=A0ACC1RCI3_9HYPO|nr:hypothetical protein NM208_g15624 [Fusarium decemcellulare]
MSDLDTCPMRQLLGRSWQIDPSRLETVNEQWQVKLFTLNLTPGALDHGGRFHCAGAIRRVLASPGHLGNLSVLSFEATATRPSTRTASVTRAREQESQGRKDGGQAKKTVTETVNTVVAIHGSINGVPETRIDFQTLSGNGDSKIETGFFAWATRRGGARCSTTGLRTPCQWLLSSSPGILVTGALSHALVSPGCRSDRERSVGSLGSLQSGTTSGKMG